MPYLNINEHMVIRKKDGLVIKTMAIPHSMLVRRTENDGNSFMKSASVFERQVMVYKPIGPKFLGSGGWSPLLSEDEVSVISDYIIERLIVGFDEKI